MPDPLGLCCYGVPWTGVIVGWHDKKLWSCCLPFIPVARKNDRTKEQRVESGIVVGPSKSQAELLKIMDQVKNKEISMNDAEILFKAWELRYKRENTFVQKLISILYKITVHYMSRSAFQIACTGRHSRLHVQVSIPDCMYRSAFQIAWAGQHFRLHEQVNIPHCMSRSAFQIACAGQHFRLHEQVSIPDCMYRSAFQIACTGQHFRLHVQVSISDCMYRSAFNIAWTGQHFRLCEQISIPHCLRCIHVFLLPFTNYNMQRYYRACGTRRCAFNCEVKDLEFKPHQGVSHSGPRQAVNLSLCKENILWPIHHHLYVFLKYG